MTTYNLTNVTGFPFAFQDTSLTMHSLPNGSSGNFNLATNWYTQAVAVLGIAYVIPVVQNEYRYCLLGFTPVATPTDAFIIQGSASLTIHIKSITIGGIATAQANMPVQIIRRSTAGTLGSAVLTAIVPALHDTTDGAPTAVVSSVGTANYTTLGTSAGIIDVGRISLVASATGNGGNAQKLHLNFNEDPKGFGPLAIRGTADFICINFNGAAVPAGGLLDLVIETFEAVY